jgi:superfamily II DNA/RNA helicase
MEEGEIEETSAMQGGVDSKVTSFKEMHDVIPMYAIESLTEDLKYNEPSPVQVMVYNEINKGRHHLIV